MPHPQVSTLLLARQGPPLPAQAFDHAIHQVERTLRARVMHKAQRITKQQQAVVLLAALSVRQLRVSSRDLLKSDGRRAGAVLQVWVVDA